MAGDRRAGQHHRASRGPAELTGQAAVGEPVRCRVPTRPPAEMSRCAPSAEGDGGAWPWGPGMRRKTQAGLAELKKAVTAQLEVLGAATPEFRVTGGASRRRLREPGTWKRGQAPNPAWRELPGEGVIGWQQLAHFPSSFPFFFFSVPCCSGTPSAPPRVLGPGRRCSLSSPASSSFPFICPRFISYLRNRDLHGATYHGPCSGGGRRSHESPFLQSWAPPWSRSSKL